MRRRIRRRGGVRGRRGRRGRRERRGNETKAGTINDKDKKKNSSSSALPLLSGLAEVLTGKSVRISFTPHLMPFSRGMQSTIYVKLSEGATAKDLRSTLADLFQDEPFVHVMAEGEIPHTRFVRGSNHCLIGVYEDRIEGRAIIVSVIDNLVKGASGQALQNMNLMLGFPEETGLMQIPMFP